MQLFLQNSMVAPMKLHELAARLRDSAEDFEHLVHHLDDVQEKGTVDAAHDTITYSIAPSEQMRYVNDPMAMVCPRAPQNLMRASRPVAS